MSGARGRVRIWTVPNVLCVARMAGVIPLLWAAHEGHRLWFLWLMVLLLATDWVDGKLAIVLGQETELGAHLDSAADALMYASFALSFWWLETEVIRGQIAWLAAVAATWGLSALVALVRFRQMPSYHTRGAKGSWLAAGVAAVLLLLTENPDVVPWALGLVILTNLEAVAIGLILPEWRANIPTAWHAMRIRRSEEMD